jgi:hypothetical protein
MSRVAPVRFIGMFHSRTFSPLDLESEGEVFFSLSDAKYRFRSRVTRAGHRCTVFYPVLHEGLVATHLYCEEAEIFPDFTEDAFIDLCAVAPDASHKGWARVSEPDYRLTLGPKSGVHVERF